MKSVDIALALKLIQLRGNIRAGEVLILEGLFLEWDVLQRSMHDALEDATLLAAVDENDKVVRRYLKFFFDEDLDKNGELTNRAVVGVGRPEVRKAIEKAAGRHGLADAGSKIARQSRQLHRARSGSVQGRAASIMRAYFEESAPTGLWLGGRRDRRRTAWELPSLRSMTSHTLSTFGLAGVGRWWQPAYCLELIHLGQRLQEAIEEEIAAQNAVGWINVGDDARARLHRYEKPRTVEVTLAQHRPRQGPPLPRGEHTGSAKPMRPVDAGLLVLLLVVAGSVRAQISGLASVSRPRFPPLRPAGSGLYGSPTCIHLLLWSCISLTRFRADPAVASAAVSPASVTGVHGELRTDFEAAGHEHQEIATPVVRDAPGDSLGLNREVENYGSHAAVRHSNGRGQAAHGLDKEALGDSSGPPSPGDRDGVRLSPVS